LLSLAQFPPFSKLLFPHCPLSPDRPTSVRFPLHVKALLFPDRSNEFFGPVPHVNAIKSGS